MSKFPTIPRRIVTGINGGKSVIIEDAQVTNVSEDFPGLVISDVWATNTMPVDLSKELSIPNTAIPVTPPNGTYFRYVSIPPDKDLGIPATQEHNRHPLFHQTDTIDYIIIASGEIYLVLEEEEVKLSTGDIVIQRGTNHAWSNRSDQPCIQLAVLIDAKHSG
ncbi:cupin domain-containing protein [Pedobacter sp. AW31-3R]|uniref:cupin domain-containing protein n=1 Tax=Pedobacter sp. AW31-3R TaxID=3445781 RepID=UPI003FA0A28D